jgi:FAD synthetase
MRVCPILEWRLADVWSFMSTYALPYCSLYDRGYASLGSRATTSICPALVTPPAIPLRCIILPALPE